MAQRGRPRKNPVPTQDENMPVNKPQVSPVSSGSGPNTYQMPQFVSVPLFSQREAIKLNIAVDLVKTMVEKFNGKTHPDMVPNALRMAEALIKGAADFVPPAPGQAPAKRNIFTEGSPIDYLEDFDTSGVDDE